MKRDFSLNNQKWKTMALLSIIVPVSLLVTFRLSGVLPEPPKPETITVEAVAWNTSRPSHNFLINESVESFYIDNSISVNLSLYILKYYEDDPDFPAYGNDYVKLRVVGDINLSDGYIYSLKVKFSRTDAYAHLRIDTNSESIWLYNLKTGNTRLWGSDRREAYFEAVGSNQPTNSSLGILAVWILLDKNNMNHWITLTVEATYYNGTVWKKIEIPIQLGVVIS